MNILAVVMKNNMLSGSYLFENNDPVEHHDLNVIDPSSHLSLLHFHHRFFNFSDVPVKDYTLRLPAPMRLVPLLSSDSDIYGGSTTDALPVLEPQYDSKEKTWKVTLDIPPFTGLLYSAEWIAPEKPKKSPSKNKKNKR